MTFALLFAYLGLHAAFIWGRIAFFRIDDRTPLGVRVIEICAATNICLGTALIVGRAENHPALDPIAILLAASSAALFIWGLRAAPRRQLTAAFSTDVPISLITNGPFRYIRNPFYSAYIMAHAIPLFASKSLWVLVGMVPMTGIYVYAALLEERKFLASRLAPAWCEYRRHTGRFMPRLMPKERLPS